MSGVDRGLSEADLGIVKAVPQAREHGHPHELGPDTQGLVKTASKAREHGHPHELGEDVVASKGANSAPYRPMTDTANPFAISKEIKPSLEKDELIFQEIREGNFDNTRNLTTITSEIADVLVREHKGYLDLRKIVSLSTAEAESLFKYRGDIGLNGLRAISADVAEQLAKHPEGGITLYDIPEVDDDIAKILAQHPGVLMMGSIEAEESINRFK